MQFVLANLPFYYLKSSVHDAGRGLRGVLATTTIARKPGGWSWSDWDGFENSDSVDRCWPFAAFPRPRPIKHAIEICAADNTDPGYRSCGTDKAIQHVLEIYTLIVEDIYKWCLS